MTKPHENEHLEKLIEKLLNKIAVLDEEIKINNSRMENLIRASEDRYRDILHLLDFSPAKLPAREIELFSEHPLAADSVDHLYPRGTANDNTRWPRFVTKCESLFPGESLNFLDLGCAGGGLVLDFALKGHFAMGLEGSDYSLKRQRAEWRTIPGNLFLCDIAKEYSILKNDSLEIKKFHVISAWDVIEHIEEKELSQFLENVTRHLRNDGYFIGSVSTRAAGGTTPDGRNHHATVQDRQWWLELFRNAGFQFSRESDFQATDFPRGNGILFPADFEKAPESGFHFVLKPLVSKEN